MTHDPFSAATDAATRAHAALFPDSADWGLAAADMLAALRRYDMGRFALDGDALLDGSTVYRHLYGHGLVAHAPGGVGEVTAAGHRVAVGAAALCDVVAGIDAPGREMAAWLHSCPDLASAEALCSRYAPLPDRDTDHAASRYFVAVRGRMSLTRALAGADVRQVPDTLPLVRHTVLGNLTETDTPLPRAAVAGLAGVSDELADRAVDGMVRLGLVTCSDGNIRKS